MRKWEEWRLGEKILAIAGGVIVGVGLAFIFGFVVMLLWNALMPRIFHLPTIGYWEGWGLVLLSSILFKGSAGGKGGGGHGERKRKRMLRERMREDCEEAPGSDPESS